MLVFQFGFGGFKGCLLGRSSELVVPGGLSGRCVSTLWQTQALGHTGHLLYTHMLHSAAIWQRGHWLSADQGNPKPRNQKTRKPCCFQEATAVTDQ